MQQRQASPIFSSSITRRKDPSQPASLTSSSSFVNFPSSASVRSHPSSISQMPPMVDHSQGVRATIAGRQDMTKRLNTYMEALSRMCPTHFAGFDTLKDCATPSCDELNPRAEWAEYKRFKDHFQFARYTYCFFCGTPNDTASQDYFQPSCHLNVTPSSCRWKGFVFKTLFILWHRSDAARVELFDRHGIPHSVTLDEFAQWAVEDLHDNSSPHYYNGLSLFVSFCDWTNIQEHAFSA